MEPDICVSLELIFIGSLMSPVYTPPLLTSSTQCTAAGNSNNARTTIGFGEQVNLSAQSATAVTWGLAGPGTLSSYSGSTTTFTAPKSATSCIVRATTASGGWDALRFDVVGPNGLNAADPSNDPLGDPGPPNNYIGARSHFPLTVLPITVSFNNLLFQENVQVQPWTWPDGSQGANSLTVISWGVGCNNQSNQNDDVNTGSASITKLFNGSAYVGIDVTLQVQELYQDDSQYWVATPISESHVRSYRGTDQNARVLIYATNSAAGSWQGPYK